MTIWGMTVRGDVAKICSSAAGAEDHFAPISAMRAGQFLPESRRSLKPALMSASRPNFGRWRGDEGSPIPDRLLSGSWQFNAHVDDQAFSHFMTVFQSIV